MRGPFFRRSECMYTHRASMEFFDSYAWAAIGAVAAAHAFLRSRVAARNALLLAASYAFAAHWAGILAVFLLYATAVSFVAGLLLGRRTRGLASNAALWGSIALVLAPLLAYKSPVFWPLLTDDFAVLPLGISFYTFQAIGYLVDVRRGTIQPVADPVRFALYLAFFPKFIAGPIERGGGLLEQLSTQRSITTRGMWEGALLIAWGTVQKSVIAALAFPYAEGLLTTDARMIPTHVVSALFAMSLYVYADFAGYTDIARGIARLFGFDLARNFDAPYFATGPRDFWRRWHASLSGWIRDYVYIPLGGSRRGTLSTYRNILIAFACTGLWHSVTWQFFAWGAYHGLLVAADRFVSDRQDRSRIARFLLRPWITGPLTFAAVTVGWVLFFSTNLEEFFVTAHGIALSAATPAATLADKAIAPVMLLWLPVILMDVDSRFERVAPRAVRWPLAARMAFVTACWYACILAGGHPNDFVYANF